MSLVPGDDAPDFTLQSIYKGVEEPISLSSMKGKFVVLMFYPLDFGYVTPTEFYQLEPLLRTFNDLNCSLLAISTEHIPSQMSYLSKPKSEAGLDNMDLRLASDPTGEVAKMYGVYKPEENICYRSNYVINPEGKIISFDKYDLPVGCNMTETLRDVQAALEMRGRTSGGTPPEWEVGQPIVETGFKLEN